MRRLSLLFALVFIGATLSAQTVVKGVVQDAQYDAPLVGATVSVKGTTQGTFTDQNGEFQITLNQKSDLVIAYVGYQTKQITVEPKGKIMDLGVIKLVPESQNLNEIYVVADRASEQRTPVAISNIEKKEIEFKLGSQDLPLVMNTTPSIYATAQGGGSGDARINVRGFDQRNVAIMINGVPVNDMENGWVYWSNWDGISDVTSSIQVQRGLSAVNLATPSVGGTINIITSPAAKKQGGVIKYEYGSGNFMKATAAYNTGMINDKFAMSFALVRKVGDGVIKGTWTDAWAYYAGMTYKINDKNKIELFAMGAPQRHGQNLYQQNLAAYSHDYAKQLGADDSTLLKFPESPDGRLYNQNVSPVDPSYTGQQWWYGKAHDRHSPDFINERENFYHKPLVNLNIYNHFSNKVSLFTVLYYSGGQGGGSGTYGSMVWDYSGPSRVVDYNATIAQNTASDTAFGILRNSVNNQWTIGALSKLRILFNENLKASIGIDWRKAQIEHYREVRDLLGGQFYVFTGNDFDSPSDYNKVLGDKIAYYFTNTVDWFGYYGQVEYSNEKLTTYLTVGNSFIHYTHRNHFVADDNGNELFLDAPWMSGYQVKTGLSYRPVKSLKTYVNLGYISKVPIFDNVISDRTYAMADNPQNELFKSAEIGAIYKYRNLLDLRFNYYYTLWQNRAFTVGSYNQSTDQEVLTFITGINELHQGVELEAYIKPTRVINFNFSASFANWYYTNDVQGVTSVLDDATGTITNDTINLYLQGIKVGDAPQTQLMGSIILKPVKGLRVEYVGRYYTNYYAKFDPTSRTDENDRAQVWQVPSYFLIDAHVNYDLPLKTKMKFSVFAHVFNITNALYISSSCPI